MAASPVLAQVGVIGVIGGPNFGTMSVSGETEDQQFKFQPAFVAGMFFRVPFKKTTKIALQIESLLSIKGVRIAAAGFTDSLHIAELELPVLVAFLAKRGTGTNIRVLAGPAFAVKLANGDTIDGDSVTEAPLKGGEVGLKVGVQFERGKIFYGASYTHGLTNFLADDTSGSPVDAVKTRTLSVCCGLDSSRMPELALENPNRVPGLCDGAFGGGADAEQVACRLDGRRARVGECRVGGQDLGERAVEHFLDLLAVREPDALDRQPGDAVRARP